MFYNVKDEKLIINEEYLDEAADEIGEIVRYKLNDLGIYNCDIHVVYDPEACDEDGEIFWFGMSIKIVGENGFYSSIDFASLHEPQLVWIESRFEFFRIFNFISHTMRSLKTLKPIKSPENSLERKIANALLDKDSEKIIVNISDHRKI